MLVIVSFFLQGEYFFNVNKEAKNNWQQSFGIPIRDGEAISTSIFISNNLNGVISSVNGKS